MNLLLVSPYPPERDGIAHYSSLLARRLVDDGQVVAVVAPTALRGAPAEVIGSVGRSRSSARATLRRVLDLSPDVVHVQFCIAAFGSSVPALLVLLRGLRRLKIPIVLTLHDVTRDTSRLGRMGILFYRVICRLADVVIVHTETAAALVRTDVGCEMRSVRVLPHLEPELPTSGVSAEELIAAYGLHERHVLLAFGFIHVDKGLDDLVQALGRLHREDPELSARLRLVVAGSVRRRRGVFRVFELRDLVHLRRVRAIIRQERVADLVAFTGYVPGNQVRPWFELAAAVILPYRKIEQSGVASLASAAGCPVLPSDVGELRTFAAGPEWVYPAGDPAGIAEVIRRFFLSARSPERAKRRPPDVAEIAGRTVAVYETLLPR